MNRRTLAYALVSLVHSLAIGGCGDIPGPPAVDAAAFDTGLIASSDAGLVGMDAGEDQGSAPPTPATCGDGRRNPGEECDDGNRRNDDGCSARCRKEAPQDNGGSGGQGSEGDACGNGIVEGDEECDDGNTVDTDGCSYWCTLVECGNGRRELDEACDDGNTDDGDECPADCGTSVCGNGFVEGAEECDDGNANELDGCSATCLTIECGNGRVDFNEECDPGKRLRDPRCTDRCTRQAMNCGDGTIQEDEGEQCDDGNDVTGDGCHNCLIECGDGFLDHAAGEACEPGATEGRYCLTTNTDTCVRCNRGQPNCDLREPCDPSTCQLKPQCGDGVVQTAAGEQCETPNGVDCDEQCRVMMPICGNGILQGAEECDEPTDLACVDCLVIVPPSCGNGQLDEGEQCDSLDRSVCDARCRVPSCEPSAVEPPELDNGGFDQGIAPWQAEFPVQVSHLTTDGATASGSLQVSFQTQAAAQAQVSGASDCVLVNPDTVYEVRAQYKMPEEQEGFRATIGLFLHREENCTGAALVPSAPAPRGRELGEWTPYTASVDTGIVDTTDGLPIYLRVRLEALRLPEVASGVVLWDDVQLVAVDPATPVGGSSACGNCELNDNETCDDGNQEDGDGCSRTCQVEICATGSEPYCSDCDSCALSSCSIDAEACFELDGAATAGPGAGILRAEICRELRSCVHRTGCAGETAIQSAALLFETPALENCYCGTSGAECVEGEANGSCRLLVEAALETTNPVDVFQRFSGSDPKYPVFSLVQSLLACESTFDCACELPGACGDGILQDRPASFLRDFVFCAEADQTIPGCFVEECDGQNVPIGGVCDENCFVVECGNRIPQEGEGCDDGNLVDGDGCDANCVAEFECGDGVVASGFEPCDTALTTPEPLCFQDDLNSGATQPGDCGCTATRASPAVPPRCELSVCGNGVVQPEAGEQCDPPIPGACSATCELELDTCTQCLLQFDGRDTPGIQSCPGAFGFNSDSIDVGGRLVEGWGCLDNAECFGMWSCIQQSGSAVIGQQGFGPFYCGFDVAINDCLQPGFVPQGPCVEEIEAAFEAQEGAPPVDAGDVFENINTGNLARGQWANQARAIAELCLQPSGLESDLTVAFDAGRLGDFTVQECLDACITE